MEKFIFHKIRSIGIIDDFTLCAQFDSGVVKKYEVEPLTKKIPIFSKLIENPKLFRKVKVDIGGYGIVWNEDIDLSSEEIWFNGKTITTSFDDLMSFSDAASIWHIEESTLRKAVSYGKFTPGIDCCKFGKQWVIRKKSMEREYGVIDSCYIQSEELQVAESQLTFGSK